MPMQSGKSSFNLNSSLQKHKNDDTDYGQDFSRLPGGIVNGVAQLVAAKMGVFKTGNNTGQKFIRLAGVVAEPDGEVVDVIKALENGKLVIVSQTKHRVKGLQTSVMIPLCDTTGTKGVTPADEHVATMMNELRKLGGEQFTDDITDEDALKGKLEALEEAKPYFRFSTRRTDPTKDYPDSRVFEQWFGSKGLENYELNGQPAFTDNTGGAAPAQEETPPPNEPGQDDLPTLVAEADAEEDTPEREAARTKLNDLAIEAGVGQDDIDAAADYAAVAALIEGGAAPEAEPEANAEPAAEEAWEPKKGQVYLYKPIDPKTKKPFLDAKTKKPRKALEVEVTAVDKKKETVDIKSLDNPKNTWKAVAWTALEQG